MFPTTMYLESTIFVDIYLPEEWDYGRPGHSPGDPILTQGTEWVYCTIKYKKLIIGASIKYNVDLKQTIKAISNHKKHKMQTKNVHKVPYQSPEEWDALKKYSHLMYDTSIKGTIFYDHNNNGKIVKKSE